MATSVSGLFLNRDRENLKDSEWQPAFKGCSLIEIERIRDKGRSLIERIFQFRTLSFDLKITITDYKFQIT